MVSGVELRTPPGGLRRRHEGDLMRGVQTCEAIQGDYVHERTGIYKKMG